MVEQGIVSSFARPGGNVTGMEARDSEIIGKRLELLKQAAPKTLRVAVLVNPNDSGHAVIPGYIAGGQGDSMKGAIDENVEPLS